MATRKLIDDLIAANKVRRAVLCPPTTYAPVPVPARTNSVRSGGWGHEPPPFATLSTTRMTQPHQPSCCLHLLPPPPPQVVVFSKTTCPYCVKAKRALESVGAKYAVMELDTRADGGAIQAELAAMTGARTVPRVFVKGRCIGGGDDTAALAASGQLAKLLA